MSGFDKKKTKVEDVVDISYDRTFVDGMVSDRWRRKVGLTTLLGWTDFGVAFEVKGNLICTIPWPKIQNIVVSLVEAPVKKKTKKTNGTKLDEGKILRRIVAKKK